MKAVSLENAQKRVFELLIFDPGWAKNQQDTNPDSVESLDPVPDSVKAWIRIQIQWKPVPGYRFRRKTWVWIWSGLKESVSNTLLNSTIIYFFLFSHWNNLTWFSGSYKGRTNLAHSPQSRRTDYYCILVSPKTFFKHLFLPFLFAFAFFRVFLRIELSFSLLLSLPVPFQFLFAFSFCLSSLFLYFCLLLSRVAFSVSQSVNLGCGRSSTLGNLLPVSHLL